MAHSFLSFRYQCICHLSIEVSSDFCINQLPSYYSVAYFFSEASLPNMFLFVLIDSYMPSFSSATSKLHMCRDHYSLVHIILTDVLTNRNTLSIIHRALFTISGNVNWYRHCTSSAEVPQKITNRDIIWFSNPTSGYLPEENKNTNLKSFMHLSAYYSIIYSSKGTIAT